jgi:hypothetical protein
MSGDLKYIGMDVHKEAIVIAGTDLNLCREQKNRPCVRRLQSIERPTEGIGTGTGPSPFLWAYHGNLHAGNEKLLSPADT